MSSAWEGARAPGLADFEAMAAAAFARLPQGFRDLCGDVVIRIVDLCEDDAVLAELGLESPYELLGLFQGIGLPHRGEVVTGRMPNVVTLYRRPILDYWAGRDETLGDLVAHVLVHEIGHHFGLSDDDIYGIERRAAQEEGDGGG